MANIRFDQAANSSPVGIAGQARRDLLLANAVTLRNGDNTGVRRWQWTLLAKPSDSSATIVNPTSAVASITPDAHGWYRVQLAINSGQYALGEVQVRAFAVPDRADQARPAAGSKGVELNYNVDGSPNTTGWAREMNDGQLWSLDNRHSPTFFNVQAGKDVNFEITWGRPDALLQMLGVDSFGTSTACRIEFFRDAAHTELLLRVGPFDASTTPYLFNTVTTLTGALQGLENRTIYGLIANDDAIDGQFSVGWRYRAV